MKIRKATVADIAAIKRLFWELDTDAVRHQPEHFQRVERPDAYLAGVIENPKADDLVATIEACENEQVLLASRSRAQHDHNGVPSLG